MNRRAFTLIEMLIVIGVIMILAGMLFFGGRAIMASSKEKSTRTTLAALSGMLAEADAKTRYSASQTGTISAPILTMEYSAPNGDRDHALVYDTRARMGELLAYPPNKTAAGQLPSGVMMGDDPTTSVNEAGDASASPPEPALPPLPTDAWGNPILFVPSGGLTGVDRGGVTGDTVTSRDARPFFASAGEDGNFKQGDDNVYSFE